MFWAITIGLMLLLGLSLAFARCDRPLRQTTVVEYDTVYVDGTKPRKASKPRKAKAEKKKKPVVIHERNPLDEPAD